MSKRSIQVQETMYCGIDVSAKSLTVAIQRVISQSSKGASLTLQLGTGLLSSGCRKPNHRFARRWKQPEFTLWISRLHLMQPKGSKSQS
jgi:hypothetical protein